MKIPVTEDTDYSTDMLGGSYGPAEIEEWILFRQVRERLDPRTRRIIEMKRAGYTNVEVGAVIGLAPQRVGQIIKKAAPAIREMVGGDSPAPVYDLSRFPNRANWSRDWRREDDEQPTEWLFFDGLNLHLLTDLPEPTLTKALENLEPVFRMRNIGHVWPDFAGAVRACATGGSDITTERVSADATDWAEAA